jgi:signal transduction histidine kinase
LENLLEWSRSQTGRIQMKPENIDLYKLVDDNVDFLQNQAGNKKIQLINKVASPTHVHADDNMLNTVIRNLISNAIKYTGEGGSITVSSYEKDGMVKISVIDTGIGIKPENIEKLFRIDVNYSTKGTADETGTGLGLILCKEFISRNKGEIWVESELGKGSTFKFTLPEGK